MVDWSAKTKQNKTKQKQNYPVLIGRKSSPLRPWICCAKVTQHCASMTQHKTKWGAEALALHNIILNF